MQVGLRQELDTQAESAFLAGQKIEIWIIEIVYTDQIQTRLHLHRELLGCRQLGQGRAAVDLYLGRIQLTQPGQSTPMHGAEGASSDTPSVAGVVEKEGGAGGQPQGIVALHDVVYSDDKLHDGGAGRAYRGMIAAGWYGTQYIQRQNLSGKVVAGIGVLSRGGVD